MFFRAICVVLFWNSYVSSTKCFPLSKLFSRSTAKPTINGNKNNETVRAITNNTPFKRSPLLPPESGMITRDLPSPLLPLNHEASLSGSWNGKKSQLLVDFVRANTNGSMPIFSQPFRTQFDERKRKLSDTFDIKVTNSEILEQMDYNHSILLVLNGRHTFFDSIKKTAANIDELKKHNFSFFGSETRKNEKLLLHVIRPHFIEFIHKLQENTHKLFVTFYSNDSNEGDEVNELISILAFIETHYSQTFGNKGKSFEFNRVICNKFAESKSLRALANRSQQSFKFNNVFIVDHRGAEVWEMQSDHSGMHIIPIQPTVFEFNLQKKWMILDRAALEDRYFEVLSTKMSRLCRRVPFGINLQNWITSMDTGDSLVVESVLSSRALTVPLSPHREQEGHS